MAIPHAASGELIDLFSGAEPGSAALVRDEHFEVFRLRMESGKELPVHEVESFLTIQCLGGRIRVNAHGRSQTMPAGYLMYLASCEPHSVKALEDSLVLVTMRVKRA